MDLMKGFQDGIRAKSVSTAQTRPGEAFICIVVSIRRSTIVLLDHGEFFAFAGKQKLLTRDKPNHQYGSFVFEPGLGDAINKRIALENSRPHGRESFPFCTNSVHKSAKSCACSLDIA
jgi:hypothetical protein